MKEKPSSFFFVVFHLFSMTGAFFSTKKKKQRRKNNNNINSSRLSAMNVRFFFSPVIINVMMLRQIELVYVYEIHCVKYAPKTGTMHTHKKQ